MRSNPRLATKYSATRFFNFAKPDDVGATRKGDAGFRARQAEKRARAYSTTIPISVTTCNRTIWREISPEAPAHPEARVNVPRPVSSSKLIVPVSPPRHILPWQSNCSADPRLWGPRLFSCKNRESQRYTSTFRFGSASLGKNRRPQRRRSALRLLWNFKHGSFAQSRRGSRSNLTG